MLTWISSLPFWPVVNDTVGMLNSAIPLTKEIQANSCISGSSAITFRSSHHAGFILDTQLQVQEILCTEPQTGADE
jgi:hypothetical protein